MLKPDSGRQSIRDKNLFYLEKVTGYPREMLLNSDFTEFAVDHPQDVIHSSLGKGVLESVIPGEAITLKIKFSHEDAGEEVKTVSINDEAIEFIHPWSYKLLLKQVREIVGLKTGQIFQKVSESNPTINIVPPIPSFHPIFREGYITEIIPGQDPKIKFEFKKNGEEIQKTLLLKLCKITLNDVDIRLERLPKREFVEHLPKLEVKLFSRFIGSTVFIPGLISKDFPLPEEGYAEIVGYTPETFKLKVRNRRGQVQSHLVIPQSQSEEKVYLLFDPLSKEPQRGELSLENLYLITVSRDGKEEIFLPGAKTPDKDLKITILSMPVCNGALLQSTQVEKPKPEVVPVNRTLDQENKHPVGTGALVANQSKTVEPINPPNPEIKKPTIDVGKPIEKVAPPPTFVSSQTSTRHPQPMTEYQRNHPLISSMKDSETIMFRMLLLQAMYALSPVEGSDFKSLSKLNIHSDNVLHNTPAFRNNSFTLCKAKLLKEEWIKSGLLGKNVWTKKGVEELKKFFSSKNDQNLINNKPLVNTAPSGEDIPTETIDKSSVTHHDDVPPQSPDSSPKTDSTLIPMFIYEHPAFSGMKKKDTIQFRILLLRAMHVLAPKEGERFCPLSKLKVSSSESAAFRNNCYTLSALKLHQLEWINYSASRQYVWTKKGIAELDKLISMLHGEVRTESSEELRSPTHKPNPEPEHSGILEVSETDILVYQHLGITFPSADQKLPRYSELLSVSTICSEEAYSTALHCLVLKGYASFIEDSGETFITLNKEGLKFIYSILNERIFSLTPEERSVFVNLQSIDECNQRINFRMLLSIESGKEFIYRARNNPISVGISSNDSIKELTVNKKFLRGFESFGLCEAHSGKMVLTPRGREFITQQVNYRYNTEKTLQALNLQFPPSEEEIIKARIALCCIDRKAFGDLMIDSDALKVFQSGVTYEAFANGVYSEEIFYLLRVSSFIKLSADDTGSWILTEDGKKFFS